MFEFLKKIIKKDSPEKKPAVKKEVVKKPEKKTSAAPKQIVTKTPNLPKKKKALKPESSIKPPPKALKNKPPEIKEEKAPPKEEKKGGFFGFADKIKKGLTKTREKLTTELTSLFTGKKIDEALFEELETILLTSDVGISATTYLLDSIRASIKKNKIENADEIKGLLKEKLIELLTPIENPLVLQGTSPFVIMVVGVNGAGKTTTIGKLTKIFLEENKSVLIAAGDTFRAAAVDQLQTWGARIGVPVISGKDGAEPAAVAFDAAVAAKESQVNFLIIDTAGRLHNKSDLMDELGKVKRVVEKTLPISEVLLVIDATTGQNAMAQAKIFSEAVDVTGLIVTKMDGSAKGGIALAIEAELGIPIKFIGTGESIEDFAPFEPELYIQSLLDA